MPATIDCPKVPSTPFEFYSRNREAIRNFLRARGANDADADDLLQELWLTYSKACHNRSEPIHDHRLFLFGIARNVARRWKRSARIANKYIEVSSQAVDDAAAQSSEFGTADVFDQVSAQQTLELAIVEIPARDWRALVMRAQGASMKEIASAIGLAPSTVEKGLKASRAWLRERLTLGAAGNRRHRPISTANRSCAGAPCVSTY